MGSELIDSYPFIHERGIYKSRPNFTVFKYAIQNINKKLTRSHNEVSNQNSDDAKRMIDKRPSSDKRSPSLP